MPLWYFAVDRLKAKHLFVEKLGMYQEDLTFMGDVAFEYYLPALQDSIVLL